MSAIIGTWKMCYDGLCAGHALLAGGASAGDAVVRAVTAVEDDPAIPPWATAACRPATAACCLTLPSWTGTRCAWAA